MAGNSSLSDVMRHARVVLSGWRSILPRPVIGTLQPEAMETLMGDVELLLRDITMMDAQLKDLRNRRDAKRQELWQMLTRVRAGVKAIYGPDSSEFEMVGGKRLSDHKPHTRPGARGENGHSA